jgi:hypothetical protein
MELPLVGSESEPGNMRLFQVQPSWTLTLF